ncbi:MAG: hypothetical protein JW882_20405 [Deltaproteobacteria bacterium]|nr:hypothetical protein [Deltaproteobacteria bacterium]
MTISKGKKKESTDTNSWMITFTNLMILLLAFFIVLVNMGVRDQSKKRSALYSVLGAFGLKTGGQAPIGSEEGSDFSLSDSPMTREEIDFEKLRNIMASKSPGPDIEIKRETGRIVISLSNRIMFDNGKSNITPKSAEYLYALSPVIKEGPGIIELRGYAGYAECALEHDPDDCGINLSTNRGLAVLHFFLDKGKIPSDRIVTHGFGLITSNKGETVTRIDRYPQVEIIIDYRQKVPYRLRVKRTREDLLDFKGFFFNMSGGRDEDSISR